MATTARGITFEEFEGSPRLSYRQDGVTATRRFKVAWADYEAFAVECMGKFGGVGSQINSQGPVIFPGDRTDLIADSIDVEPFEPSAPVGSSITSLTVGGATYASGALVTVQYKQSLNGTPTPDVPELPDFTYLSTETDVGAEYFTVPSRTWKWSVLAKQLPPDITVAIIEPVTTYNVTWHYVVSPPWSTMSDLAGHVNNAPLFGKAADTILFCGCKTSTQWATNTVRPLWNLTYVFKERAHKLTTGAIVGWNYFYNENLNGVEHWQLVVATNGGQQPYKASDLGALFGYGTLV